MNMVLEYIKKTKLIHGVVYHRVSCFIGFTELPLCLHKSIPLTWLRTRIFPHEEHKTFCSHVASVAISQVKSLNQAHFKSYFSLSCVAATSSFVVSAVKTVTLYNIKLNAKDITLFLPLLQKLRWTLSSLFILLLTRMFELRWVNVNVAVYSWV